MSDDQRLLTGREQFGQANLPRAAIGHFVKGVVFRDRGVGLQIAAQRGDGFALLGERDLGLPEVLAPRLIGVASVVQCEFFPFFLS